MVLEVLRQLFARDLDRLYQEVNAYPEESGLWVLSGQIANTGGNLCLHLLGNLQTYIGKELGGVAYTRDRDAEFSLKNVPRKEMLEGILHTARVVDDTLSHLKEEDLAKTFPVKVFSGETTTGFMLIHLATHLSYHLGQINYHRRLLDARALS